MNKLMKSILSMSVCFLPTAYLVTASDQFENNSIVINQQKVRQEAKQLADNQGAIKRDRMRARAQARAIGAADRKNRLMERREKHKQELERRRALFAQKQAERTAQGKDEKARVVPLQKPAAPQNTMLNAQATQKPIVIKSPLTQLKKS